MVRVVVHEFKHLASGKNEVVHELSDAVRVEGLAKRGDKIAKRSHICLRHRLEFNPQIIVVELAVMAVLNREDADTRHLLVVGLKEDDAEFYFEDALCLRGVGGTGSGKQGGGGR